MSSPISPPAFLLTSSSTEENPPSSGYGSPKENADISSVNKDNASQAIIKPIKIQKINTDNRIETTSSNGDSNHGSSEDGDSEQYMNCPSCCSCQNCPLSLQKQRDSPTQITFQIFSRLLKSLDRESKFKNTLLSRHLDIIENTLFDNDEATSSSDEE